MSLLAAVQLVLADGVSSDQERALAAVMLGLVVFAAVFTLFERQRSRRGRDARKATRADGSGGSSPPAGPVAQPGVNADLPAAPVHQAAPVMPQGVVPEPLPVVMEPVPAPNPTEDHPSVLATPASPDEIGIVIPDDQPPPGTPEQPLR